MANNFPTEFAAGALFGSALLASGVYSPAVIIGQMQLRNFHMMKSFLTASVCSMTVVQLADRNGHAPIRIRQPRSIGFFPYDANVLGGALVGVGMALAGACPGTVFVQVSQGLSSGVYALAGTVVGGLLFAKVGSGLLRGEGASTSQTQAAPAASSTKDGQGRYLLQSLLSMSTPATVALYEILCLGAIATLSTLQPDSNKGNPYLPPVIGGLCIGVAQAASLSLNKRTVGMSSAYGDVLRWAQATGKRSLLTPSTIFALGVLAGSCALSLLTRDSFGGGVTSSALSSGLTPQPWQAVLGGASMIFGALLAGGCPSGHGISGMATLSLASFASVAGMFGGGIALAKGAEWLR